ncbi:MAG: YbaB/EbfC family nucleoid-associated protein [Cyclobacteriaceae bacterium]
MFDLNNLMGKMKDVQEKMKVAQENLGSITQEAESGAGMVKATVNGKKQVVSISIAPELMNEKDKKVVEDLVVAAVNKALEDIEPSVQEEMQKATDGVVPPNIPGFDLGSLFNK